MIGGRFSDSCIFLLTAPSQAVSSTAVRTQWSIAVFVCTHSGGSMPDFHRLPF